MKQYLAIVKLIFKNMFKIDKTKSKGFYIGIFAAMGVLYLTIAGILVAAIIGADYIFGIVGQMFGQSDIWGMIATEFAAIIFAFGAVIVVLFGIIPMLQLLYFSRDTEFFLALPVKPGTVFAAKFTVVYLTELILSAALLLPTLITLGVVAGMWPVYYFVIVLGILFTPSIPLVFVAILGIPLMYIIGYFKNKGALTSIVAIVLFGAVFAGYYLLITQVQNVDEAQFDEAFLESLFGGLKSFALVVFPYLALARLASGATSFGLDPVPGALVNFALSFGVAVALLALAVLISSKVYSRGAAAQLESGTKKTTGKDKHIQSSAYKALCFREWKMMLRTPSFALQCLMPIVITPIIIGFLSYSLGSAGAAAAAEGADLGLLAFITEANTSWYFSTGLIFMMGVGLNVAAATAFTREGKGYYIAKTLPVSIRTQIRAKMTIYMLISLFAIVLSTAVAVFISPEPLYMIFCIAILCLYAYGFNCFAVLFDLMRPKLDWTTPNEAMKQNFNVMIPLFINMGVGIIMMVGAVLLSFNIKNTVVVDSIVWSVYAAIAVASAVVFHKLLYKKADAFYARMGE
ncbi:MAG: hypothetical protein FWD58_01850 [Firmicutes bacterium]|nr:hypothetical protein [Bacillota bacterium]